MHACIVYTRVPALVPATLRHADVLCRREPWLTLDDKLPRSLFGGDDIERGSDAADVYNGLVGLVRSRHSQFKVSAHQEVGRDVL